MPTRRITYGEYKAYAHKTGDVFLRFLAPGSKFGGIEIILACDDAEELSRQLDKAIRDSWAATDQKEANTSG